MNYLTMQPHQVRTAIQQGVPAILPLGVIEYHAEHLPLGTDSLTCIEAIRRLEARHPEIVVLPPFYYGAASNAVAGPEGKGGLHIDSAHLIPVAEDLFRALLRVGFRNIHAFIAHQTEEFDQGMPTDLAFRFAARHVVFDWLEHHAGGGWWGTEKYSSYYSGDNNPFAWIQVHPILTTDPERFPGDHAGRLETSEILAIHPEAVDLSRIDGTLWYARSGQDATAEYGNAALDSAADAMASLLHLTP